ncbi:MAG: HPr(Ser) kinase/phosphatase [bacterium]
MSKIIKSTSKIIKPEVRVGDFYANHARHFQLKLVAGSEGMKRLITEGSVNRLGLALTGFYEYFADQRVQVVGKSEHAYLQAMPKELRQSRSRDIFEKNIPCVIFAYNIKPPSFFLEEADKRAVPVFCSGMTTIRLINSVTVWLESDFAPSCSEQGSMVDIQGVGVLIRGESGIGKSECVLGLIERGYSLVSDDVTRFRSIDGWELMGTSAALTRHYMEVRGLGIINVASIFGACSIRHQKRLDLVVTLKEWHKLQDVDRIGLDQQFYEILNVKVPHITLPVRSGRDLSGLVEVAALDQKLKLIGQNSSVEFNEKLIKRLQNTEDK